MGILLYVWLLWSLWVYFFEVGSSRLPLIPIPVGDKAKQRRRIIGRLAFAFIAPPLAVFTTLFRILFLPLALLNSLFRNQLGTFLRSFWQTVTMLDFISALVLAFALVLWLR